MFVNASLAFALGSQTKTVLSTPYAKGDAIRNKRFTPLFTFTKHILSYYELGQNQPRLGYYFLISVYNNSV